MFSPYYGCKNCGYEAKLHRHGFYSRNVITFSGIYRISILRLKCPSCNKTYSLLPCFLVPYYQYCYSFIFLCLYYTYLPKLSYSQFVSVIKKLNPDSLFTPAHISNYKRRMEAISPQLNLFFANFDEFYYDMDNHDPQAVLEKIELFIKKEGHFNCIYFSKMSRYFFAKP